MVFFDFVGTIEIVINPKAAGLVVFAMAGDDLAAKTGFNVFGATVVTVATDPVILAGLKLHCGFLLIGDLTRLRDPRIHCPSAGFSLSRSLGLSLELRTVYNITVEKSS